MTISRSGNDSILVNKTSHANFNWLNEYVEYKGDKEALSQEELQLSKKKSQETPAQMNLYKELLNIVLKDISTAMDVFFKDKKGF
jgi:hypothetical protein